MGGTYNRPKALKQLFFDVFVGAKTGKLHWTTFVSGSGWGSAGWVGQCTEDTLQVHLVGGLCHTAQCWSWFHG